jgi:PAS domain S-box-containing protein
MSIKSNSFWSRVKLDDTLEILLNSLPGIQVFAKDLNGRFTFINNEAQQAFGKTSEDEILGKTDFDIFDGKLAENYVSSDREIFETQKAQTNITEMVPNRHRKVEWVVTNKIPLFDLNGQLMGLLGTCQNFNNSQKNLLPYLDILSGVEYIEKHYMESINIAHYASLSHMSIRQFERKFKNTFMVSPREYIMKTRVQEACTLLLKSKLGISEISLRVGFYDQSAFTRQFKKIQGSTPGKYRRAFH